MLSVRDISEAAHPLLDEYGFGRATLFGSFADGSATPESDVDLLVEVPKGTKTKVLFSFAFDLGEVLGVDVDAYGTHELDPSSAFYRGIVATGLVL